MADTLLDYGVPDGAGGDAQGTMEASYENNPVVDPGEVHLQDAGMDAEMQEWEDKYEGTAEDYEAHRQRKVDELLASRRTKFYALPRDQAVQAGAQRGVGALPALAEDDLVGEEMDEPVPDTPSTIGQGLDIRFNALHITGLPITQCSTSRLFAFITHYGAQPLGLEWINDQSCNVVFSDAASARLAIEYLCPAISMSTEPLIPLPAEQEVEQAAKVKRAHDSGEDLEGAQSFDWTESFMQSVLLPRKAHRIPGKLYNAPERDAAAMLRDYNEETAKRNAADGGMPSDVPEIYREMEEEDRQRFLQESAQTALRKLRSALWVRWAVESYDVKGSRAAQQSKWYRDHGRDAGKEVVSKVLQVGGAEERLELLPGNGHRRARGRGDRGAAMDELDREMDAWRDHADDAVVGGDREARRSRRRGSRSAVTMEALDEEMEMDRRERSASPVRRTDHHGRDGNPIKVRGRGRMRAPSAWDDDADLRFGVGRGDMAGERYDGDYNRRRGRHRGGRRSRPNVVDGASMDLAHRLRTPANSHSSNGRPLDQRISASNNGGLLDRIR